MSIEIPASLKQVAPYIQKSKELVSVDPVVAHYCKIHAVEVGCKVSGFSQYALPSFAINASLSY
jgi:vacuolar protein sorting-associated protein VTA1